MFYINYYYSVDAPKNRNLEQNIPLDLRQNSDPMSAPRKPSGLSKRHKKAVISAKTAFYL